MFGVGFNSAESFNSPENIPFEVSSDFNFHAILQPTLAGAAGGAIVGGIVGGIVGTFAFPALGTVAGAAVGAKAGAAAVGLFTAGVGFVYGANNAAEGGLDGSAPRHII